MFLYSHGEFSSGKCLFLPYLLLLWDLALHCLEYPVRSLLSRPSPK